MATSKRYKELKRRIEKLRKALLPGAFDATGSYRGSERVHLRAISFRILAHAEIEQFIEDRAYELFDEAWNAWTKHKTPSLVLAGLLGFSGHSMQEPPSRLGAPAKIDLDNIEGLLSRVKNHWKDEVYKGNHGLKESNVLALLLPLGIDGKDLDTTLLADLTSFGGLRGAAAHKSSVGVINFADPKSEHDRAIQLITALKSIDELIESAIARIIRTGKALTP